VSIPVRNNLDLGLNQLLSALAENVSADPGTVTNGRVIYNTTSGVFKVGQAGSWVSFLVSTTRLDQLSSPTSPVALNSQKISGLADGTAATDAVTKQQLDAVIAGLDTKASVRVASTANVTIAGPGAALDAVTLSNGDRVLLKNQTAPAENGVWLFNGAASPMTRATDFDTWAEVPGSIVAVEVGTANADTVWLSTADQGGTLGTTGVTFTKIAPVTGGSGTVVKFSADITGNASATQFTVTHNLATTDVHVQVWEASTNAWVLVDVTRVDANNVRVDFATAPVNAKVYRVVVLA
jgi:hypothetical protein